MKINLPPRPADGNKGTFGRVCVVGGCENYPGAPILCGKAAYRSGCGLVEMIVLPIVRDLCAAGFPEAIWSCAPLMEINFHHAYAIGPGMGKGTASRQRLREFLTAAEAEATASFRVVVDADALNILSEEWDLLTRLPAGAVLTPHPGEMSRLLGCDLRDVQSKRERHARDFAEKHGVVLLLKGAGTVIVSPDGQVETLPYATSALAVAGSGDVLSGVIASLMAQGLPPFEAAVTGASLHARAGLLAAAHWGNEYSVTAGDLVRFLPAAITEAGKTES